MPVPTDPSTAITQLADVLARLTEARSADVVREIVTARAVALTGAASATVTSDNTLHFVWAKTPDATSSAIADALARAVAAAFANIATFAEAERNAAQLHAVLDSVSDSYYALDRNWNFTEFSPSAERYFRLKREDVIGRNLWELFPAGRNQVYEDTVRAAMDKNTNGRLEAPSAFNPGNTVEMRTAPMEGGISVAITDITERRKAEIDARRQARQLQAVLDAAPVAIWIARDSGVITGNRFAREIMRQHAGENIAETVAEANLTHVKMLDARGAEIPPEQLPVLRATRGETVGEFECRLAFDDGSEVTLYGNAVPLRDRTGAAYGSVSAFADITHLKQVERDLTNLTGDLEARVAAAVDEREAALTQLHEAQKTEALGQIAGGVAHDFNNLLSPIIGGLDLVRRRGVADERTKRLIDGAIESAERARTLVQRMLAFARRQPLQKSAIDIAALVENLQTLIVSSVGTRVHIAIDTPQGLPRATADANQLELALLNLALNARDAMPDGGVLTIAASEEAGFIRLAVTDTGIGMDAATLKRATEPFFSTKGVGKGTGLGLSMVHGLAAQLGGRLELSSTQGVGTTAALLLPIADSATDNAAAATATAPPQAFGRLLLVDDEHPVRETTRAMLEDLGYSVTEAASAAEALRIVEAEMAFDWLITDHMMPGMTGADLARAIRQRYPRIRTLVISGFAEVDELAPDLPRLAKPFRQDELAGALASGE
jgi:PAS domain S-box-containing protein